ncbi:hypothetical protein Bhyg_00491, partial [Pseudolycoriella hygida]
MMDRESLAEWAKDKPLSILQLDPADRAVLRIAVSFECFEEMCKLTVRGNLYRRKCVIQIFVEILLILCDFLVK